VRKQPLPVSSIKISQPRARLRQVVEPLGNAKDGLMKVMNKQSPVVELHLTCRQRRFGVLNL
jgi:hypothetical protein